MASASSDSPLSARRRFLARLLLAGGGWSALVGRRAQGCAARASADARAILAGLLRRYGRLTALTADFTQVHQGRQTAREQGTLALKRDGRMRWDYAAPYVKQFICDGKRTYFYSAARGQYTVEPVRASRDPRTPFLFLLGDRRAAQLFSQAELAAEPPVRAGYVALRLTPRERIELVAAVLAECHPTTFELARISLLSAAGARDDFMFSNIVENPTLPERFFEFAPPPGAQRAAS
ncbi:MAG: hypothetical protein CFK52_12170 [Chloracidobacterium sp. CP2_5A]|nr:MAG: hypothetical protein CFK52_12170 [Chloracidobacterium sp. CP2_5A]